MEFKAKLLISTGFLMMITGDLASATGTENAEFKNRLTEAQSVLRSIAPAQSSVSDQGKLADVTYDPGRGFRNWNDWNNATQWNDWGNFRNS